ncbi:hypothetical protein SPRG_02278 [Saprolegnia parasitica CBS 223.65]|uniref:Uncharacterized protein n=1 Tax=Saprolegnia parasitica (strain CBS 223.65) TaxID=695850 RepID=A0A067CW21_SAPPC|nr:hypothetical protein SPRG_02278 [Saprolegnia parasitica CBS 223.65]KDO33470.1 hypothetical protein SPRG_02278 [Saprolegnia parasitica CBS 223.65]|eukprot:XP_012196214.1 hypothetical protein SPRG_02278 [Saprolegnia parasitica CBS 223.65]
MQRDTFARRRPVNPPRTRPLRALATATATAMAATAAATTAATAAGAAAATSTAKAPRSLARLRDRLRRRGGDRERDREGRRPRGTNGDGRRRSFWKRGLPRGGLLQVHDQCESSTTCGLEGTVCERAKDPGDRHSAESGSYQWRMSFMM